jgi:CheY-like chemotaxis protein
MLRVLVVDDDPGTVASLRLLLETWGFEAWTARDGQTALEMAPAFPPEVVILDLAMPGLDGYAVARRLRQTTTDGVCIICMSGYGAAPDRQRSREAGCDHHLLKPADPEEVRRLLESRCRAGGHARPAG